MGIWRLQDNSECDRTQVCEVQRFDNPTQNSFSLPNLHIFLAPLLLLSLFLTLSIYFPLNTCILSWFYPNISIFSWQEMRNSPLFFFQAIEEVIQSYNGLLSNGSEFTQAFTASTAHLKQGKIFPPSTTSELFRSDHRCSDAVPFHWERQPAA